MKAMRSLLFLAVLPISLIVHGQVKEPYLTKTFPKGSFNNVTVKTSGGSIEINGGSESEARVEVYVSSSNGKNKSLTKEEIRDRLSDYELIVGVNNRELEAIARPRNNTINWKRGLSISFKVFAPKAVSTDLSTSGGSVRLANLSGKQTFRTSGGSLNVEGVTGNINGRTSGGSIQVSNSYDDIDLETSGGSINANNCRGKISLRTSGGSLNLNGLNGTVKATTSGGSVRASNIKGELITGTSGGSMNLSNLACSLETSTAAGSVHVQFAELGKYVKIHSGAGHVDLQVPSGKGLDLDLRGSKIKTSGLNNFAGITKENSIEGTLSGGGIPVEVRVSGGNINFDVD